MTIGFALFRPPPSGLLKSAAYDVVMRLPMFAWSVSLALALVVELEQYNHTPDPATPRNIYLLNIAMRLSMIMYLVILAATVVSRAPPIGRARGAEPRITALFGSFLITAVVLF